MMRIPFRRRRSDLPGPAGSRARSGRSLRSSLESLEARQLLARVQAAEVLAGPVAPRVAYVQFEPLTGRVRVTFTGDASGIDPARLTKPANYSLVPIQVVDKGPSVDP